MKSIKVASITTQTRPSNSQILNNSSLLNRSAIQNNYLSQNIQQCQNRENSFLRIKNQQLNDKIQMMAQHIRELQENKLQILSMNAKYVKVVNQYYRDLQGRGSGVQNICNNSGVDSSKQALGQLQKEHRNLVKHCLVMEDEIKNYIIQMQKYNLLKEQLRSVNHTNVTQLINQLTDLSAENKHLRKENNRITFELEKSKLQNENLKKQRQKQNQENDNNGSQIQKMLSLVNTVKQQSKDRALAYQSKIYQLQVKVQKLESQLRKDQQYVSKNNQLRRNLQIQQVQNVHETYKLKNDLSNILDSKKRHFLSSEKLHPSGRSRQISHARKSFIRRSDIFE